VISDLASTGETFTFYPHYLGETLIHPKFFEVIDHTLQLPEHQHQHRLEWNPAAPPPPGGAPRAAAEELPFLNPRE
jgi:hypothetical protein